MNGTRLAVESHRMRRALLALIIAVAGCGGSNAPAPPSNAPGAALERGAPASQPAADDAIAGQPVSRATWTDGPWPLTVDEGRLWCEGRAAFPLVWFQSSDRAMWPLNGTAMSEGENRGGDFQPSIERIHAVDEPFMAELEAAGADTSMVFRISVGPMIAAARRLCTP